LKSYIGTDKYEVRNYGISGHTMLKKGDNPYWNKAKYQEVLQWDPDIVIIKLGTNDAKPKNWVHKDEFEQDYTDFVNSFKNLPSKPKIYVCYPLPAYPGNWLPITEEVIKGEIIPIITAVAEKTGATVIDLHTPFEGKDMLVFDKVHPNLKGTTFMAHIIAKVICPGYDIPELPEDLFLRISSYDYTEKMINLTSTINDTDLSGLTDKSVSTQIEVPYAANTWFAIELSRQIKLTGYGLTSGRGDMANSPKSWKIQGSNNGKAWTDIDVQRNIGFYPTETKVMETPYTSIENLEAYKFFRFMVTANNGGEKLNLSEWQLFGFPGTFSKDITKNGGVITGQHTGYSGETVENLIDGKLSKKYCVADKKSGWVQYISTEKVSLEKYTLTSCFNLFERNPKSWELLGSNDGSKWDVLDSRKDIDFMVKFNTMEFSVQNQNEYLMFRLNITENNGGSSFQFSEWQLFKREYTSITAANETKNELIIYPNPVKDRFEIRKPLQVDFVELTDISGKTIKTYSKGLRSYPVNSLSTGAYIVVAKSDNKTFTCKIVKQ